MSGNNNYKTEVQVLHPMENINSFQAFLVQLCWKKKKKNTQKKMKDKKRGQGRVSALFPNQYLPEDIKPVQANGFNEKVCQSTSGDSYICFFFCFWLFVCLHYERAMNLMFSCSSAYFCNCACYVFAHDKISNIMCHFQCF